jgi:protein ImuB
MKVPSYDDLMPGIPDVVDSNAVDRLATFFGDVPASTANSQRPTSTALQSSAGPGPARFGSWELGIGSLFACLRLRTAGGPLHALLAIARDFSPRVMAPSEGEVLIDVAGLGRLIGAPPAIARELARALSAAGAEASVAIAPTQTAARLLATQFPDYPISRLPDLPVSLLEPLETLSAGIDHRDRRRPYETFERWGIATLGDLTALPAAELSSRLGRRGVAMQRLARGLDPHPFVPDADTPRFIGRLELEWPIDTLEPLSFVFARLLDPLSAALERADRGAVAIHLDLRLTDRSTHTRRLSLPAPMRDPRVLRTLLLLDLESVPLFGASEGRREPPRSGGPSAQRGGERRGAPPSEVIEVAIDVVAIELDPAPARITQFSLLHRALPSPETVSTLIARLSALVGESRIGSAALVDSHAPDAFEMRRFAPDAGPEGAHGALGASGALGAQGPAGASGAVFRRQRLPPAIRVAVEHGRPVHLAASRRGLPCGAIVQAAGPWRASGGWWTDRRWSRNEWDIELAGGAVCRIFQDRSTERWFLEGIYD